MRRSKELEVNAIQDIAEFMAVSARTAPKTRGIDNIEIIAVEDKASRDKISNKMKELSQSENRPSFSRDAGSIAESPILVVIGVKSNPAGLNCGFCGHKTCEEMTKAGGVCSYNSIDLGIAVSSAVEIAARFHADNRIMYSIGRTCIELGLFGPEVRQALGIPLSVTGKNPFFDRN